MWFYEEQKYAIPKPPPKKEPKQPELNFLGLDFSTQKLKAIIMDKEFKILHEADVEYDQECREYNTRGGVVKLRKDGLVSITCPTTLFVRALDLLFEKLQEQNVNFSAIRAISGCAQQHVSVFWKNYAEQRLWKLNPEHCLHDQLQGIFSFTNPPSWMDMGTRDQCDALEAGVGSPEILAQITGSRACRRYTGPHIAKIYQNYPDEYNETEKISLLSSFAASVLLGRYAPIDYSDASGMNLFDIKKKDWSDICLDLCAPKLRRKLGQPVPSNTNLGRISPYYVKRYGFNENCHIVAFTGDNPASLAATIFRKQDVAISMGTSDTMFMWLTEPIISSLAGQILVNPIDEEEYMALMCFKNGSLTRQRVRDRRAKGNWADFSLSLTTTPRGNSGNMGFYFDAIENFPEVVGDFRFDEKNKLVRTFTDDIEIRALIEGQFLRNRFYAEQFGVTLKPNSRVIAAGGASVNEEITRILADVFNAEVYTLENPQAGCIGSCYRARYGIFETKDIKYHQMFPVPPLLKRKNIPAKGSLQIYGPMLERFGILMERIGNVMLKDLTTYDD